MTQAIKSLKRAARILLGANLAMKLSVDFASWKYAKSVIEQPIPTDPVLYLHSYSIINNPRLLVLLKKACYTPQDVRAGWIRGAIPHTDSVEFRPLAKWATEHWAMYSGFLPHIQRNDEMAQILDVGCGLGHATVCLATVLDMHTVIGIDIDDIAIRFAERFNKRSNVRYIQGDFLRFTSSQRYAYIFALEILEHLPPALHYMFIDKCLSMLTEEGLLFVTTPNSLDVPDSTNAHVGLLNRVRAHAFIERYKGRILDASFYDNQELLSADPSRFVVQDPIDMFEDTRRNRSHFRLVMR